MKLLIIEDEALAVEKLKKLLGQYDPHIEILACLPSIKKTRDWFRVNETVPDLILMDIRVSDGLIFEIFPQVQIPSPVIFITAYDQYAIQAFKSNGIDYLLKPIDFQDIKLALDRFKERYAPDQQEELVQKIENLLQVFQSPPFKSRFLVKSGQKLIPIGSHQIAYFYKEDIVLLMTLKGEKYAVNFSLDELEKILNPQQFFRVNRQFIVQTEAIASIHQYFKGKLKLKLAPETPQEIIISQEKSALFKAWLNQ